ncbi:MAG: hypothetical protein RLZZ292_2297 [Bacteroidota bacterium]|jgi:hypothetical protein
MKQLFLFVFCGIFFNLFLAKAQSSNQENVFAEAVKEVRQQVTDSIAFRSTESVVLRKKMIEVGTKLGYAPIIMFGPNNDWINKGMHRLFERPPVMLNLAIKRDKNQVILEQSHVALFYSDLNLAKWEYLLQTFDSLTTKVYTNLDNGLDWKEMEKNTLVQKFHCDLVRCWQEINVFENITDEEVVVPSLDKIALSISEQELCTLPIPDNFIRLAHPALGQVNFYFEEGRDKVGYIYPPSCYYRQLNCANYFDEKRKKALFAEWTNRQGKVVYTNANYEDNKLWYSFPKKFFQKGQCYRLRLLKITYPDSEQQTTSCEDIYFNRVNNTFELSLGKTNTAVVFTNYFRISKYTFSQKIALFNQPYQYNTASVTTTLDEPFDQYETLPFNQANNPNFPNDYATSPDPLIKVEGKNNVSSFVNLITDKKMLYYLSVPRTEDVDTIHLDKPIAAELDHTLQESFTRKPQSSNQGYPYDTNDVYLQPYSMATGYVRPAYHADSFIIRQNVVLPKVNATIFRQGTYPLVKGICTITIPSFKEQNEGFTYLKKAFSQRIKERAHYFHALDIRQSKKEGKQSAHNYEYYYQRELYYYVPQSIKNVLDLNNYRSRQEGEPFPEVFPPSINAIKEEATALSVNLFFYLNVQGKEAAQQTEILYLNVENQTEK